LIHIVKPLIEDWLAGPGRPQPGPLTLTPRRIFILPTKYGFGFAPVLLVMLAGSVSYGLSLGFVLTFLLGSVAIVSILHAYRNLAELRVTLARAEPVFAGETVCFPVHLENPSRQARFSVGLAREREEQGFADIPCGGVATIDLRVPAARRGVLRAGRFTLFTPYPIGLFFAWSPVELEASCLVYPRPDDAPLPPPARHAQLGALAPAATGDEDFSGLKPYQPGDSPRRIAWKASVRGETLLTKQFAGQAADEMWLDWADLPAHFGVEARLSRLASWVLQADRSGASYGLRLPGRRFDPAAGEKQRQRCLEALARFDAAPGARAA
jgi:uncharacterized protein (DUF58 family)